jgi:hypothetical protein
MPDCTASCQSGTATNKNAVAESSSVLEQGNPVRYWTNILGAGILMLVALVLMPMPSYGIAEKFRTKL